jgi:large subunit ribosomal protein L19
MTTKMQSVEAKLGKSELPEFKVGDHVQVAVLIREAAPKGAKKQEERQRIQNFIGDVIAMGGTGLGRSFTVRRVVQGEGVERVFPIHSPQVTDVTIVRHGKVRRAKLYDLREKSGKAARIKERTVRKGEKVKGSKAKAKPAAPASKTPEKAAE